MFSCLQCFLRLIVLRLGARGSALGSAPTARERAARLAKARLRLSLSPLSAFTAFTSSRCYISSIKLQWAATRRTRTRTTAGTPLPPSSSSPGASPSPSSFARSLSDKLTLELCTQPQAPLRVRSTPLRALTAPRELTASPALGPTRSRPLQRALAHDDDDAHDYRADALESVRARAGDVPVRSRSHSRSSPAHFRSLSRAPS